MQPTDRKSGYALGETAVSDSRRTTMPRRKHKKSRLGCLECKRRRIKCDENRPICSQCTVSERICEYAELSARFTRAGRSRSRTFSTSVSSPGETSPSDSISEESLTEPPVNMLHAELFHHLVTETLDSLKANTDSEIAISTTQIMTFSIKAPYLLNELLALAATHISITRPAQRDFYRSHALQLQNHALNLFSYQNESDNVAAYMPRFLFSSILSLHVLCGTLVFRDDDFNVFLDAFIQYLRLNRGVRAVIGKSWRALTACSNIGPVLSAVESQFRQPDQRDYGPECSQLLALIDQAKLGPSITATYHQAIEALQLAMCPTSPSTSFPGSGGASMEQIFMWPANVPMEYIELLELRSPDALVVLAHYGAVLHAHRQCWFLNDGGRFLIESIRDYLGPEWSQWMTFPSQALMAGSPTEGNGRVQKSSDEDLTVKP